MKMLLPSSRPTGMVAFVIIWLGQYMSTMGSGLTGWGLGGTVAG